MIKNKKMLWIAVPFLPSVIAAAMRPSGPVMSVGTPFTLSLACLA